jgi:hypothetical protein
MKGAAAGPTYPVLKQYGDFVELAAKRKKPDIEAFRVAGECADIWRTA